MDNAAHNTSLCEGINSLYWILLGCVCWSTARTLGFWFVYTHVSISGLFWYEFPLNEAHMGLWTVWLKTDSLKSYILIALFRLKHITITLINSKCTKCGLNNLPFVMRTIIISISAKLWLPIFISPQPEHSSNSFSWKSKSQMGWSC